MLCLFPCCLLYYVKTYTVHFSCSEVNVVLPHKILLSASALASPSLPPPRRFRPSSYLAQCLLNSMSCQDGTCKWDLTVGELYKCNNITQLLFNFESSILDTATHKGWFESNYPLLLPKSTIKRSIKADGEKAWAVRCRCTAVSDTQP